MNVKKRFGTFLLRSWNQLFFEGFDSTTSPFLSSSLYYNVSTFWEICVMKISDPNNLTPHGFLYGLAQLAFFSHNKNSNFENFKSQQFDPQWFLIWQFFSPNKKLNFLTALVHSFNKFLSSRISIHKFKCTYVGRK